MFLRVDGLKHLLVSFGRYFGQLFDCGGDYILSQLLTGFPDCLHVLISLKVVWQVTCYDSRILFFGLVRGSRPSLRLELLSAGRQQLHCCGFGRCVCIWQHELFAVLLEPLGLQGLGLI